LKEAYNQLSSIYKNLGLKEVPAVLIDSAGNFEQDKFLFKELLKFGSEKQFSFNAGGSIKNVGISLGYTPDVLMKTFEVHGILANSWEDTFNFEFKPKIGIGVSVRF
jgi:hypothetical protein